MKVSLILPGLALFLTPVMPDAAACATCACGPQRTPVDARSQAHAVFSGRVIKLRDQSSPPFDTTLRDTTRRHEFIGAYIDWTLERREVAIEVHRVWKGEIGTKVETFTGPNPDQCGFAFEVGKDYLVYAQRAPNGRWRTNICMRTRPLADAKPDFADLGAGVAAGRTSESIRPPHN